MAFRCCQIQGSNTQDPIQSSDLAALFGKTALAEIDSRPHICPVQR
ncbi:hypothetical protein OAG51_00640 [Pirellulaceae bacterium]|nr:hypothetical protein [Pirellulaceae bacterium]